MGRIRGDPDVILTRLDFSDESQHCFFKKSEMVKSGHIFQQLLAKKFLAWMTGEGCLRWAPMMAASVSLMRLPGM